MIRAVRSGGCRMTVTGHAGYAEKGQDIVCAGVSALVETLETYLRVLQADGAGQARIGHDMIEFFPTPGDERGEEAFDFAETGLLLIATRYPAHVIVTHRGGVEGERKSMLQ